MFNERSEIQENEKKSPEEEHVKKEKNKKTDAEEANAKVKQAATESAFQEKKGEPKEDFQEKYFRLLAEMENTRKRMQKEKQETIRFAIENAIGEFLPALDNFEKALKFADQNSEEVKNWAAGFQMILSQIKDVLHNHGIVAYHSEGNIFDPNFHEAIEVSETNESPDGTILEEYTKGYKSANRTIRPAKVRVAREIQKKSESEQEPTDTLNASKETPETNDE